MYGSQTRGRNKSGTYRHRRPGPRNRFVASGMVVLVLFIIYYMFFKEADPQQTTEYRKIMDQTKEDFLQAQLRASAAKRKAEVTRHTAPRENDDDSVYVTLNNIIAGTKLKEGESAYNNGDNDEHITVHENKTLSKLQVSRNNTQHHNVTGGLWKSTNNTESNTDNEVNVQSKLFRNATMLLNTTMEKLKKYANTSGEKLSNLVPIGSKLGLVQLQKLPDHFKNKTVNTLSTHLGNLTKQMENLTKAAHQELSLKAGNWTETVVGHHVNKTQALIGQLSKDVHRLKDDMSIMLSKNDSSLNIATIKRFMGNITVLEKQLNFTLMQTKLST